MCCLFDLRAIQAVRGISYFLGATYVVYPQPGSIRFSSRGKRLPAIGAGEVGARSPVLYLFDLLHKLALQ